MAVVQSTAVALTNEIDARCSDIIGSDYDDLNDAMKDGIFKAVGDAVYAWLTGGASITSPDTFGGMKVVLVAGDLAGTDSAGDTPDNVTADGGGLVEA